MRFVPDTKSIKAMGRIRRMNGIFYLGNAGSYLEFELTASRLRMTLDTKKGLSGSDYATWLSVSIDGTERAIVLREGICEYPVFAFSSPRTVTVRLTKRSESGYGNTGILALDTDAAAICPTAQKKRRIEFIGDSITCGYGCEQTDGEPFDTSGENCRAAYAVRTAEMLDADYHLVAQSGIGVLSSCVEENAERPNVQCLMPRLYRYTDLSCDEIRGWSAEVWNPDAWRPQLIVVNLGTNDALFVRSDLERTEAFGAAYECFLRQLIVANPDAAILGTLGVMNRSLCDEAAHRTEILRREGQRVGFFRQTPQDPADGIGSAGHPSARTHEKSAEELATAIREFMDWP